MSCEWLGASMHACRQYTAEHWQMLPAVLHQITYNIPTSHLFQQIIYSTKLFIPGSHRRPAGKPSGIHGVSSTSCLRKTNLEENTVLNVGRAMSTYRFALCC